MPRTSPPLPEAEPQVQLAEAHAGRVARLVLHAPAGNALDVRLVEELERALDALARWPDLACLVVEGSGTDFSTGLDASQRRLPYAQILYPAWHRCLRKLAALECLLVAQIRGRCLGAALELALVCEARVSDQTGRFAVPDLALGAFAPGASVLLPARLGGAKADELLLSAATIDSEEAQRQGIVTHLAGGWDSVRDVAEALVTRLVLPRSTAALRQQVRARRRPLQALLADELSLLEEQLLEHLRRA